MTGDISELAHIAYEAGISPLDYAEGVTITAMRARDMILSMAARECDPQSLADPALSDEALARRIIAGLLDAGWSAPIWPVPEPGACT